ncbi:MAG: P27 family phage terminase small subunit [Phycisphaerales bacterium]
MGLRGPAPKPTALKEAAGNPGKRELSDDEPMPPAGDIAPPKWLTSQALEIWTSIAPVLIAMRTLTTADVPSFGRYCTAYARWLAIEKMSQSRGEAGLTFSKKGPGGRLQFIYELPQAAEQRRLYEILQRFEDRFGLNASSRSRIRVHIAGVATSVIPQQASDDVDRAYFAGGGPVKPRLVSRGESKAPKPKKKAKAADSGGARSVQT